MAKTMEDVSPGVALGSFVGGIAAVLKIAVEVIKWRNERRLKEADARIPMSMRPPALPAPPPALTHELKLQAKEIELMRAQYQIDQLNAKLADAERREAQLSARVTEQELLNRQLVDEMAQLRRQGGDDANAYDSRSVPSGPRKPLGARDASRDPLRAPGRPGDRPRR